MKQIPNDFQQRMKEMMNPNEFQAFIQTYEREAYQGLRVNTLKLDVSSFLDKTLFHLTRVPWCPTGFYYSDQDRPGKHPYHAAGLYYIQEPSAMSVVEELSPKPGETILDLCAAPGGKSTHIAAYMQGEGLLISNEINPTRSKALSENIERCGVTNAIVTNETPEKLADRFPLFFDRILVDAPCSGEGMFRKLDEACEDWSSEKVVFCANLQEEILECAARMLKPGGTIIYSTCTFAPDENERKIAQFLHNHTEFELQELKPEHGMSKGRAEWAENQIVVEKTLRLWPHLLQGEGHFVAKLCKNAEQIDAVKRTQKRPKIDKQALKLFHDFQHEWLNWDRVVNETDLLLFGEHLYLTPQHMPSIDKLKVVRPGWHLGTVKKGRFEPSHSLALGVRRDEVKQQISLAPDDPQIYRYLKGESLPIDDAYKGWTLLCVDEFPLGWGKVSNGQFKNHYPKGLRWP